MKHFGIFCTITQFQKALKCPRKHPATKEITQLKHSKEWVLFGFNKEVHQIKYTKLNSALNVSDKKNPDTTPYCDTYII